MHNQLKLFLVGNSFLALAMGMFGPIYAIFVEQLGGTVFSAGAAWSVFMIITGIGILLSRGLHDKYRKDKAFMIISYVLRSLSFLGYFFLDELWQLYAVQVLLGLSFVFAFCGFCVVVFQPN